MFKKDLIFSASMGKYDSIIKKHKDGTIINLFVTPGADSIIFPAGYNKWRKCIDIKVCSADKNNKANKDVIKTVAGFMDIPISDVLVVSGDKKREKKVLIKGTSTDIVTHRLKESLNGL